MPVTYGTFVKQLKLLPLTLTADGRATVAVRFGYVGSDGVFTAHEERAFQIDAAGVSEILDAAPTPGMTRRDDLSYAVYGYLVTHGLIEPGDIT